MYEPFKHRQRDDHLKALGAFWRLHIYAGKVGDTALQAVAVLKAIQKLEQLADEERSQNSIPQIVLPDWVRLGFWDALRALVAKSPGRSGKRRPASFKTLNKTMMQDYSRWAAVTKYVLEDGMLRTPAVEKVRDDGGGTERTIWESLEKIDEKMEAANALDLNDDDGHVLQKIEARDLVPTQKFGLLIDSFS